MLHFLTIFATLLVLSTIVNGESGVECISHTFSRSFSNECKAKVEAQVLRQWKPGNDTDLMCSALGASLECARNVIAEKCGPGAANHSFMDLVKRTIKEKQPEMAKCPALATDDN